MYASSSSLFSSSSSASSAFDVSHPSSPMSERYPFLSQSSSSSSSSSSSAIEVDPPAEVNSDASRQTVDRPSDVDAGPSDPLRDRKRIAQDRTILLTALKLPYQILVPSASTLVNAFFATRKKWREWNRSTLAQAQTMPTTLSEDEQYYSIKVTNRLTDLEQYGTYTTGAAHNASIPWNTLGAVMNKPTSMFLHSSVDFDRLFGDDYVNRIKRPDMMTGPAPPPYESELAAYVFAPVVDIENALWVPDSQAIREAVVNIHTRGNNGFPNDTRTWDISAKRFADARSKHAHWYRHVANSMLDAPSLGGALTQLLLSPWESLKWTDLRRAKINGSLTMIANWDAFRRAVVREMLARFVTQREDGHIAGGDIPVKPLLDYEGKKLSFHVFGRSRPLLFHDEKPVLAVPPMEEEEEDERDADDEKHDRKNNARETGETGATGETDEPSELELERILPQQDREEAIKALRAFRREAGVDETHRVARNGVRLAIEALEQKDVRLKWWDLEEPVVLETFWGVASKWLIMHNFKKEHLAKLELLLTSGVRGFTRGFYIPVTNDNPSAKEADRKTTIWQRWWFFYRPWGKDDMETITVPVRHCAFTTFDAPDDFRSKRNSRGILLPLPQFDFLDGLDSTIDALISATMDATQSDARHFIREAEHQVKREEELRKHKAKVAAAEDEKEGNGAPRADVKKQKALNHATTKAESQKRRFTTALANHDPTEYFESLIASGDRLLGGIDRTFRRELDRRTPIAGGFCCFHD